MNTRKFWWIGLMTASVVIVSARAATVTAALDPAQISMGESAQLTVTVSGAQEQPAVPPVDGLEIISVGQSTQIEIVNGSMTANATRTYAITPQHEGTFTIPALKLSGASSQPLTLRVFANPSVASTPQVSPASPPGRGPVVLPPSAVVPSTNSPDQITPGKYGSIELSVPKKEFYEGEVVPIQVKVFLPSDLQIVEERTPELTGDGFALEPLEGNPAQGQEVLNNRVYTVLTWQSSMSAVKTGDYAVKLTMPLTVVVPQRLPQPGNDDDTFNDFFRNAFANMGQRKTISISGSSDTLKVLPLPKEGRPASFSGAIGQFDVEAHATPTKVNVGDPLTLQLKIHGRGNFDRVSSEMLSGDTNWKVYSPKGHFDPDDRAGLAGTKTFEQPAVPNNTSISAVPALTFSYFDPEARRYVTRTTDPIPVSVMGSPSAPNPSAPPVANAPAAGIVAAPTNAPFNAGPDLRANRIETGSFTAYLKPVYLHPLFLAGQAVPLLALLGGLALLRRQRHVSHPDRLRHTAAGQEIRRQVEAMNAAFAARQADAFFVHARNALQQRFGAEWNMRPEAITAADLAARLDPESQNLRTIFEMADQASYSDLRFEASDLEQWRQIVLDALKETKK